MLLVEGEARVREVCRLLPADQDNHAINVDSFSDSATKFDGIDVSKLDVALVEWSTGDGIEVLRLFYHAKPDLPVVLMIGYDASSAF